MSSAPSVPGPLSPHDPSPLGAFLSYLIPGLGQMYQGRYGKGALFMISLLGMFFLGQAMGNWQNVYIHSLDEAGRGQRGVGALITRWHYGGQFWIGVAAWPALWQHFKMPAPDKELYPFLNQYQKMPDETKLNQFFVNSDKTPDLGWVYTVVAGMLNILVMYDAFAGPVILPAPRPTTKEPAEASAEARKEGVA